VLTAQSSIETSRKRKLSELFIATTSDELLPNIDFIDADKQPTDPAEIRFLNECDILQYVFNCPAVLFPDSSAGNRAVRKFGWLMIGQRTVL
jgi:hypothetical protein